MWLTVIILATVFLNNFGFFAPNTISRGISNIGDFLVGLFPPDLQILDQVSWAILETLQMAFVGTFLGFLFSIPLGLLGARNIFGGAPSAISRLILSALRTIPSLLWAIIFVIAFGLGPLPGTLGLAAYSFGYLGKLYYEIFEAIDPEVLEASKALGTSKLQQIRHVIIPESANNITSQLMFMFEYNVRASAILGFVGAGGVGFYMLGYLQLFQYQRLTTALLMTLAVVLLIDFLSVKVRDRFLIRSPK